MAIRRMVLLTVTVLALFAVQCGAPAQQPEAPAPTEVPADTDQQQDEPAPTEAPAPTATQPEPTATEAAGEDESGDAAMEGDAKAGGTLVVGVRHEPDGMDIQTSSLAVTKLISQQVYEPLVEYNQDLELVPALAESWEQPDESTLVFQLREGVLFHDGSELTAEDVKFTLDRVRDEETASPWSSLFDCIDSVEATDTYEVTVNLTGPCAPILGYLAHASAGVFPKAYVEGGGNLQEAPVGTGPFKVVSWDATGAELVRHEDYWREGLPYLDGMNFVVNADENARATSVRAGTVDFLQRAPDPFIDILRQEEGIKVLGGPVGNFRYILFNAVESPVDDYRVRQAIAWALDREEIMLAATAGLGETLPGGPIPSNHWAALPEPCFEQDYDKARALLEEAGYADGFDITFLTISTSPYHVRATEVIKEQLEPLGINLEINMEEQALYIEDWRGGNFVATVLGFSGQVDPDQFMNRFRSDSGTNLGNWSDEHFDELADQGVRAQDPEERQEIYWEAQRYLCEQSPMAFLYAPYYFDAMKNDVMGFEPMFSEDYHLMRNIWLDR